MHFKRWDILSFTTLVNFVFLLQRGGGVAEMIPREAQTTLINWMAARPEYLTMLIGLRAVSRDWCMTVTTELRRARHVTRITPRQSFIPKLECMCCGAKKTAEEIRIVYPDADELISFCVAPRCKLLVLIFVTDHLVARDLHTHFFGSREAVNAMRSSGILESNWSAHGIRWSVTNKRLTMRMRRDVLVKDVYLDVFWAQNPGVILRVEWSFFHDPDWVRRAKKEIDDATNGTAVHCYGLPRAISTVPRDATYWNQEK